MQLAQIPVVKPRSIASMPRMRTGLRLQTGPTGGAKGLAHMVNYLHMADGGNVTGIGALAAQGQGGDNALAHISTDEMALLDRLHGGTELNPQTGLPQYGWFGDLLKGLVRAGAAIGGGMIGGPLGAAAGSGLANKLTGGSWSDALKSAAFSGIGAEFAQGIGGGGWSPTHAFGSGAGASAEAGITQNADKLSDLNTMRGALGQESLSSLPQAMQATAPSMGSQFMSAAKSMPGLAAGLGALSQPLNSASSGAAMAGSNGPAPFSVKPLSRTPIPYQGDISKYGQGPMHKWYDTVNPAPIFGPPVPGMVDYSDQAQVGYADGGNVTGLGAPTADVMNQIQQAAMKGYMAAAHGGMAHAGPVHGPGGPEDDLIDAKLSNGEHVWTEKETTALGDGDNAKGQKRMYALRKQVLKKGVRGIGNMKISPRAA